jgi:hypothetical protein
LFGGHGRGSTSIGNFLQLTHIERRAIGSQFVRRSEGAQPRLQEILKVAAGRKRIQAQRHQDPALVLTLGVGVLGQLFDQLQVQLVAQNGLSQRAFQSLLGQNGGVVHLAIAHKAHQIFEQLQCNFTGGGRFIAIVIKILNHGGVNWLVVRVSHERRSQRLAIPNQQLLRSPVGCLSQLWIVR